MKESDDAYMRTSHNKAVLLLVGYQELVFWVQGFDEGQVHTPIALSAGTEHFAKYNLRAHTSGVSTSMSLISDQFLGSFTSFYYVVAATTLSRFTSIPTLALSSQSISLSLPSTETLVEVL